LSQPVLTFSPTLYNEFHDFFSLQKDTISKLLEAYKSDLSEYLTATLRKVNDAKSHQNALKYRISSLLDDVKPVHDEAGVTKVRGTLRTINHVLIAYALTQTEDIISMMPALRKLYKNLVSGHPGVQPLTSLALTSRRSYAHGLEQEQKMRARQNVIALDCDDRELLESAFMSYVVENHLDEVSSRMSHEPFTKWENGGLVGIDFSSGSGDAVSILNLCVTLCFSPSSDLDSNEGVLTLWGQTMDHYENRPLAIMPFM